MPPDTDILNTNCLFNYQNSNPIPTDNYKNKVNFSIKDTLTVDGKHKSNNKYVKPYIHKMLAYLFTGKHECNMDELSRNFNIPETTRHFGLNLEEHELNDIFKSIDNLLNQQIKDDRPSQLYGLFKKENVYNIEIILRKKNDDLIIINIYEFEVSSNCEFVCRVVINYYCYKWVPKNKSFDFELYARCRYCRNKILFINNVFEFYYCPKHGYLHRQQYIMYEAKVLSSQQVYPIRVPSIISSLSDCPFLDKNTGSCLFGIECVHPHSEIEKQIRNFISEEKINLQILSSEQQRQRNCGNPQQISGELFRRNLALHKIVEEDDINEFKEFLLFAEYDILGECNANYETILHVATRNDQQNFLELLLDPRNLMDLFEPKDLPSSFYSSFVNHKSQNGETALDILLDKLKNETDELNKKRLIDRLVLFIECEDCELENALLVVQEMKLEDLEELIRRRQFERELYCN